MEFKATRIEIIGKHKNTIDNQFDIIKEIPHLDIKARVGKEITGYIAKLPESVDIVLVNLSDTAIDELKAIQHANLQDTSVIVIGDKNNVDLLRVAISANIREFLSPELHAEELLTAVNKIILGRTARLAGEKERKLNVVINSKGGSGASFIASNVAYLLSKDPTSNVALVDMDLQFGTIGLNFDLEPRYTIAEVLNSIDEIDHESLRGYLINYSNTLQLLLPSLNDIVLPGEISPQAMQSLLYTLQRNHNQVVIDLPRVIDPVATTIFENANVITIVVQQTLAQYRDGRRLIHILNKDLDIPLEKIIVVINRYDANNSLKKSDMIDVLNHANVFTVSNDFKAVAAASNLGDLLCHSLPKSKIAKDLSRLATFLGDIKQAKRKSWFSSLYK